MQWTDRAGSFVGPIEASRFFERVGVCRDNRIDGRAFFVEGLDAIEIHLHQLAAGELPGFISSMNIIDGGFDNVKRI